MLSANGMDRLILVRESKNQARVAPRILGIVFEEFEAIGHQGFLELANEDEIRITFSFRMKRESVAPARHQRPESVDFSRGGHGESILRWACYVDLHGLGNRRQQDQWSNVVLGRGIKISMDGKGRYLDDIFVERLWRSLKYEEVYLNPYDSMVEAREGIGRYLTTPYRWAKISYGHGHLRRLLMG